MKVLVQLAIMAGVAIAVFAVPAAQQTRADWPRVEALVEQLSTLVSTSLGDIQDAADQDNPNLGVIIGQKIDVELVNANIILQAARKDIADQTLDVPTAQGYLRVLLVLLGQLQVNIQPEVLQLSLATQNTIRITFSTTEDQARVISVELYAAIEA